MGKVLRGQCDRQAIYDRPLKSIKQTYSHFHHIGKLWQNFQLRVALNLNLELCETFYFLWLTSTVYKVIEPKSAVDEEGDKIDSLDAFFCSFDQS